MHYYLGIYYFVLCIFERYVTDDCYNFNYMIYLDSYSVIIVRILVTIISTCWCMRICCKCCLASPWLAETRGVPMKLFAIQRICMPMQLCTAKKSILRAWRLEVMSLYPNLCIPYKGDPQDPNYLGTSKFQLNGVLTQLSNESGAIIQHKT